LATKSKSKLKFIGWMMLLTIGLSGTLLGLNRGNEFIGKSYFQTQEFEMQLNQYLEYLSIFKLNTVTKEGAKKNITVTQDEIKEHRYKYGDLSEQITNVKEQYRFKIEDALEANNDEVAKAYTEERDTKIEDITNNFKSDEHVRVKIVKEKEDKTEKYYKELENYRLDFERSSQVFKYYLQDTVSGETLTNLNLTENTVAEFKKEMLYLREYDNKKYGYINDASTIIYKDDYNGILSSVVKPRASIEGWVGVSNIAKSSLFFKGFEQFQQRQLLFYIYTISGILSLLLALYLNKKFAITRFYPSEQLSPFYNRIALDIRLALLILTFFIAFVGLTSLQYENLYINDGLFRHITEIIFSLFVHTFFVTLTYIQGALLFDRIKEPENLKLDLQQSLVWRVKDAFLIRSIGFKILLLLGVIFAAGIGFTVVLTHQSVITIYVPLFIMVVVPTLIILANSVGYLNRIINHARELAKGNLEPDLPVKGKSVLATLADNINTLKHGVKESQSEQAKSERLKTELITNVSHDLRTPLTSIITYTELLKTPDLSKDDQDAYIQIIDRKSKRLKVLIDDLFEASKMVSGSVELAQERIDLVQLLQQALAEHTEAINESTLQLRVSKPEKPVYAIIDGQKLWRVFDNLIGNILKYSLENTRVFISIKELQGKVVITFKNVTKYELGEGTDELFERFKRGDTSRNTEGSGLGLAIAKSIVDLHGGSLDIEVDGDLFKVTVTLGM